jgi:hypothetical protein
MWQVGFNFCQRQSKICTSLITEKTFFIIHCYSRTISKYCTVLITPGALDAVRAQRPSRFPTPQEAFADRQVRINIGVRVSTRN